MRRRSVDRHIWHRLIKVEEVLEVRVQEKHEDARGQLRGMRYVGDEDTDSKRSKIVGQHAVEAIKNTPR